MSSPENDLTPDAAKLLSSINLQQHPRDRQPVRTTFKLSEAALEARAWAAGYHRISLAETVDLAASIAIQLETDQLKTLLDAFQRGDATTVRRTIVLSTGALRVLNETAEKVGFSRDELLDTLLQTFYSTAKEEAKDMRELYEQAFDIIREADESLRSAEKRLEDLLGPDDPVANALGQAIVTLDRDVGEVEDRLSYLWRSDLKTP
jgi:hypothetical protein